LVPEYSEYSTVQYSTVAKRGGKLGAASLLKGSVIEEWNSVVVGLAQTSQSLLFVRDAQNPPVQTQYCLSGLSLSLSSAAEHSGFIQTVEGRNRAGLPQDAQPRPQPKEE
jgi:hypothetical protein